MKNNKTISHSEACKILQIHKDRLHRLCVNGVGPARKMVLIENKLARKHQKQWRYKLSDILEYVPVWTCRNCKKPIPTGQSFCSEECREICRTTRKKRNKQANGYATRFAPGMHKSAYEVICPVCDTHHTIYADVKPDKFVYCPEHKGRRTWSSEDSIGRVVGCLI